MVPRLISISEESGLIASFWTTTWSGKVSPSIPVTNEISPKLRLPKTAQLPACFLLSMRQKAEQYSRRVMQKMSSFSSAQRWSYWIGAIKFWMDGGSTYYLRGHGGVKNCELYSFSILTKFVYGIGIYQRTLTSPDAWWAASLKMRRRWVKMPLVPRKTPLNLWRFWLIIVCFVWWVLVSTEL